MLRKTIKITLITSVMAFAPIMFNDFNQNIISAHAQQAGNSGNSQNRITRIIIEAGTGRGQRRIVAEEPGSRVRITAPRARRGNRFVRWAGDTRILNNRTIRQQVITVPRSSEPLRLVPVYREGAQSDIVIDIAGQAPRTVQPGETITVRARNVAGQEFVRWEGASQFLSNPRSQVTQLRAPRQNVSLRPIYRRAGTGNQSASNNNNGGNQNAGNNNRGNQNAGNNNRGNQNAGNNNRGNQNAGNNNGGSQVTQSDGRIRIISHTGRQTVRRQGDTLVGRVNNPGNGLTVTASIGNFSATSEVDSETGRFVVRLNSESLTGNNVRVDLELQGPGNRNARTRFTAPVAVDRSGLNNVMSRITYGATPGLYRFLTSGPTEQRVRSYIRNQLNAPNDRSPAIRNLGIDNFAARNYPRNGNPLLWKIGYGIYSDNQLREVMTEFWDNHFFTADFDSITDIRDIRGFRQNAFGKFRDLLEISATSPSMMQYLNNTSNFRDNINENYGRELLELHTLGQEANYGPRDVIAVSRVMTGWTRRPARGGNPGRFEGEFTFTISRHDKDDKVIPFLNTTIRGRRGEAGFQEGQELLDILANHPSTRSFVCGKMVQRFVSDDRPNKYVNACAEAWRRSDGDMGDALGAILLHEDYQRDVQFQRTKVKNPYEAVISLMRAFALFPLNDEVSFNPSQNPFFFNIANGARDGGYRITGTPDGNPETADEWLGTGSLLKGMSTVLRNIRPGNGQRDGVNGRNRISRFDPQVFVSGARAPTAEGVADYMLTIATANGHKADELRRVATVLRGNNGIFDIDNRQDLGPALRRAMTVIATLPNTFIE